MLFCFVCFFAIEIIGYEVLFVALGALAYSNAYYGAGNGTIFLNNVGCSGNEVGLLYCSSSKIGSNNCGHSEDAGVHCAGMLG